MSRAAVLLFAAVLCPAPLGHAKPRPDTQVAPAFRSGFLPETRYWTGDPALDGLQDHFQPTLEANRKEFQGKSGAVRGFGAGAVYPQIWLRDSATLLPLSRYHYGAPFLTSWILEHLAHQQADGLVNDWVAVGETAHFRDNAPRVREVHRSRGLVMSADRNTSSADQEAALLDAAWQVTRATGDALWLRRSVQGVRAIDRLDRALTALLETRMDRGRGLLRSAFTADWGDVSPAYGDQRVIYQDEATPTAAGLYVNAYFVHAARSLADLHGRLGDTRRRALWTERADAISRAVNETLWRPGRGFYLVHAGAQGPPGFIAPDDSDRFALGGNAVAALYHVASDPQSARIFAAAEKRQRRYALPSIGGVLLPPYPTGFFAHPILKDEFAYQNGGQWDWFSGRLILAEFQRGHARPALAQLLEIAQRVKATGGLYEWNARDGAGRGSSRYAGSAGALGGAVLAGLFGVDLAFGRFSIAVRLGERPGQVRVHQPATGGYIAYDYRPEPGVLRLRYESNAARGGEVAVLLPAEGAVERVVRDGQPFPGFRIESVGRDRYVAFTTDGRPHRLEIRLAP